MSRRRIKHAEMDRRIVQVQRPGAQKPVPIAVRGDADAYRAANGIRPRGLRPKPQPERQKQAA